MRLGPGFESGIEVQVRISEQVYVNVFQFFAAKLALEADGVEK